MIAVLAACVAAHTFHVAPVQVHGPYFADEVAVVRAAVAARVGKLPDHCPAPDAERWVELAAEARTRPDGPRCASRPYASDLLTARGVSRVITASIDEGQLTFQAGDLLFEVKLTPGRPQRWPAQIARARGKSQGAGGGGRLVGLTGAPMGVVVDLYRGWKTIGSSLDEAEVSAALTPCREAGPRDPHRGIEYTVVVALDRRGKVTRAEHREAQGSEVARSCILDKIQGLRFPPGATRAIISAHDQAPEPIPYMKSLLNFRVDSGAGLIGRGPFYAERRFHRCPLPLGETAFTLKLDATGRVVEAGVPSLDAEARACAEDALRHVAFPCPEGGPTTVEGHMEVR